MVKLLGASVEWPAVTWRREEVRWLTVLAVGVNLLSWSSETLIHNNEDSDFAKLVNSPYFVDKTGLIAKLTASVYGNNLITAPRRFGKSTNLNMIKRFFECPVYANGTPIPKEQTVNYQIFTSTYKKWDSDKKFIINKTLDVFEDSKTFKRYFGELPVIYLNFKELRGLNYQEFLEDFKTVVTEVFTTHRYLIKTNKVGEDYRYCFNKAERKKLSEIDLEFCLEELSKILHRHFNRPVLVLIDEYDTPMQKAIFNSSKDLHTVSEHIYSTMNNLFRNNSAVWRALINACTRLTSVWTYDPDSFYYYPFDEDHPFNKYYGLTRQEVEDLAKRHNSGDKVIDLVEWYGGYGMVIPNTVNNHAV